MNSFHFFKEHGFKLEIRSFKVALAVSWEKQQKAATGTESFSILDTLWYFLVIKCVEWIFFYISDALFFKHNPLATKQNAFIKAIRLSQTL